MDERLPNIDVWMFHRDLSRTPGFTLPDGYRTRSYHEGDVRTWVRIQQAADPFFRATAEVFARSLPGDAMHLAERVMFLVDPSERDIGTITAWDRRVNRRDLGQIHWVAIIPAAQGRGLAKPMLSLACAMLRARGYTEAMLETNTRRIPALNLYLRLGFSPHPRDETEREAWRTIAPRLKYPVEM